MATAAITPAPALPAGIGQDGPPRSSAAKRTLWLATYVVVALAPLAFVPVAAATRQESFGTVLAAGLGFAGLTIMALQMVTPSRLRPFTVPFGADLLLRFHRSIGQVAFGLVVAHIVVLMIDDTERLALFVFPEAPLRAKAGAIATLSLGLLVATSLWRRRFKLSYEGWRLAHIVLGTLVLTGSLVHVLKVGKYLAVGPIRWGVIGLTVLGMTALLVLRVTRPLRARLRAPYEVAAVRRERGGATTLELAPVSRRHKRFQPGDFAWIKLGDRPLSLTEHPFSYSSSAERDDRVTFTIKETGDFTSAIHALQAGTRVLVDGPHGSFHPANPDGPYLLIAGGIGITPAISTLRTFADRGDEREVVLLYLNRQWDDVTFREELDELSERLNLRVVHVLSRPHEGWDGETGRIRPELLDRVLPLRSREWNVFICASPPVTTATLGALEAVGFDRRNVHAEHFTSV